MRVKNYIIFETEVYITINVIYNVDFDTVCSLVVRKSRERFLLDCRVLSVVPVIRLEHCFDSGLGIGLALK